MRTRLPLALAAALVLPFLAAGSPAQEPDAPRVELKSRFVPAEAAPGATVVLEVTATIAPGFHVYGSKDRSGSIPTTLTLTERAGLEPVGGPEIPPGEEHGSGSLAMHWLEGEAVLRQKLRLPADARPGTRKVKGHVGYMACDEEMCDPPTRAEFETSLVVLPGVPAAPQDAAAPAAKTFGTGKVRVTPRFEPNPVRPGERATLHLRVEVVPGWHVYGSREKTSIPAVLKVTDDGPLEADGAATVPEGLRKPTTGSYELEGAFEVTQAFVVPAGTAAGAVQVAAALHYMACDESMCDPPTKLQFTAPLVVAAGEVRAEHAAAAASQQVAVAAPQPDAPSAMQKLTAAARFVPATVRAGEPAVLEVPIRILPGWHAYGANETNGEPPSIQLTEAGPLQAGKTQVPPGEPHEAFGMQQWQLVSDSLLKLPVQVPAGTKAGSIVVRGSVEYTVCDENLCDPPASAPFTATLVVEAGEARSAAAGNAGSGTEPPPATPGSAARTADSGSRQPTGTAAPTKDSASGQPTGAAAQEATAPAEGNTDGGAPLSLWLFLLAAVGTGLVTLAMPCTYPMIPITISFFTKQATTRGGSVLGLALTYGLGIVLMFVLIGLIVGPAVIVFASHPITNVVIGVMFVLFALALFGAINLQPPQALMNAAGKASRQGGYLGVFLMGATLVITSFTCTAPFIGTLLGAAGKAGGLGRVALGMAVFGLTMALPFVVLSLVPGRLKALPRSGEWMHTFKVFLGFAELAFSLKFFSNADLVWGLQALPRELFLFAWAAVFGIATLYLLGTFRLEGEEHATIGPKRMTIAVAVLMFAVYCAFGGLGYRLDRIMMAFAPPYSAVPVAGGAIAHARGGTGDEQGPIVVIDDYDKALATARTQGRRVLINFTGFT